MLTPDTMTLIKSTIPLLESAGPALTQHFYDRMLSHNSELKNVFNLSNQRNGRQPLALFNAIAAYAKNIDNLGALTSAVEQIAQKHTAFLITPAQYDIVGTHLLATLQELGGEAVTPEILDAWAKAYGLLAGIFIAREEQLYQERAATTGGWRGLRPFIIQQKITNSSKITSFILAPKDGLPVLDYHAGQYLSLSLQHPTLEHTEIRQYSLSTLPNGSTYRITVKRHSQGATSCLLHDHYDVGDEVAVIPPAGDFFLPKDNTAPLVLLSAGVGLTPLYTMLQQQLHTTPATPILWLHATENSATQAFSAELQAYQTQYPHLQSHLWYEQPLPTDQLGTDYDSQGRMTLTDLTCALPAEAHYYFCGPIAFMSSINAQLLAQGIAPSQLHYELFGPHKTL